MIKNLLIATFFTFYFTTFCSQSTPYILISNKELTKTDQATSLHFNYEKGCISVTDLTVFQDNITHRKYIDFSECYRKIAKKLECGQNNIDLRMAYRDQDEYQHITLHNNTYILLDFLSKKFNILFMKKKFNFFEAICCCR